MKYLEDDLSKTSLFLNCRFFFPRFSCQVWTLSPFSGTRALREALGGPVAILDHSQPHEDQQAQHLGIGSIGRLGFWTQRLNPTQPTPPFFFFCCCCCCCCCCCWCCCCCC